MNCDDCKRDISVLREYAYMLRDEVWELLCVDKFKPRALCIGCVEARLGRVLDVSDFNLAAPLTIIGCFDRSERLLSRIGVGMEYVNSLDLDELTELMASVLTPGNIAEAFRLSREVLDEAS